MTANTKMTNRERKIWMWEKRIRRKNDHPLSREGWIMFLGDKINDRYLTNGVLATICFAFALAGLNIIVAFNIAKMDVKNMHVPLIFSIFAIAFLLLAVRQVKPIERIREGIILKEEGFKTYDEIRDQCENAGVILKRKNNKLLKEKDVFYEEHHNSGNKKMNGIRRNYYHTIVEIAKEDPHLDNELLTKMFEMRMTNRRHTIFAFLGLLLMVTLTIVVNFSSLYWAMLAVLCLVGFLILWYCSAGLDRYAIKELKALFKAMKKLDQLENESDAENQNP